MSKEIRLERVLSNEQVETVAGLATTIWTEHYTPIIGRDQVEYMLDKFQSIDAIKADLRNGSVRYFLIVRDGEIVGYAGIKLEETRLFLSKIYVLSSERGNGAGKKTIELIKEVAASNNLNTIYLTVNKENTNTIGAYQKFGFAIKEEVCADIGKGYVMDDYLMELEL